MMIETGPETDTPDYVDWKGMIDAGLKDTPRMLSVQNVPPHHAQVFLADAGDIAEIFGDPSHGSNFIIGNTREQNHPVCIDLDKFVQRSSGVFGATGTGKSFLTRVVLAGLINYNKASVMVLDMHNEYGFDDVASDTKHPVVGLKSKFKSRVKVVGLGAGSTIRGQTPDFNLELAANDISTSDIEALTQELNLKETTPTTLNALYMSFRDHWFEAFKSMNRDEVETEDDKGKVK